MPFSYNTHLIEVNAPLEIPRKCDICLCLVCPFISAQSQIFYSGKYTGFVSMVTPVVGHRGRTQQETYNMTAIDVRATSQSEIILPFAVRLAFTLFTHLLSVRARPEQ